MFLIKIVAFGSAKGKTALHRGEALSSFEKGKVIYHRILEKSVWRREHEVLLTDSHLLEQLAFQEMWWKLDQMSTDRNMGQEKCSDIVFKMRSGGIAGQAFSSLMKTRVRRSDGRRLFLLTSSKSRKECSFQRVCITKPRWNRSVQADER